MRIPNLNEMISQVEQDKYSTISLDSILRNECGISVDLRTGLNILEDCLTTQYMTNSTPPVVDLCIVDTIDKHVYREQKVDIHHAVMSVVFEVVEGTEEFYKFDWYFRGGAYPPTAYFADIRVLLNAIARLQSRATLSYLGETT